MKKLIIFYIAITITFSAIFSVSASGNINFKLSNAECDANRLVDIEVVANGSQSLSAVTFEFTYDKSMFEFRGTKSNSTIASVKSNELDDSVKAVYLCTDGADISSDTTIFTITFKAIKAGTGYIDFSVFECVDKDVEFMEVGSCTSAKITVNGSSQNDKSGNNNSSKSNNSKSSDLSGSSDDNKSSKRISIRNETTTPQATVDNLGTINPINDNKTYYIIIGVFVGILVVSVLAVVFFIGRKTANMKK